MNEFQAVDPRNGSRGLGVTPHNFTEARDIIKAAAASQRRWADCPMSERSRFLHAVASRLEARAEALAQRMVQEMGKPLSQGRAEVQKCAWVCRHYADTAAQGLAPRHEPSGVVHYRPVGVILGVMPWNFPLWQVFRVVAPALMAGNAVVFKPAPQVPGCALDTVALFEDEGDTLVQALFVRPSELDTLMATGQIRAATLTGGETAGRSFAMTTAKHMIPTVLELGGNAAALVLEDADLDLAARECARGRLLNNGQSCIATKRVLVVSRVFDRFLPKLVDAMRTTLSDPGAEDCQLGPMARVDLRDGLHRQVQRAVEEGGRTVLGGEVPNRPGAWYPSTIVYGHAPESEVAGEEWFGPALQVFVVDDDEEAVRVANNTPFGLGTSIYTTDPERAKRMARSLVVGAVSVNGPLASDPRLPFGGTKGSGYGRELGLEGLRQFTLIQAVTVSSPDVPSS